MMNNVNLFNGDGTRTLTEFASESIAYGSDLNQSLIGGSICSSQEPGENTCGSLAVTDLPLQWCQVDWPVSAV